jgi:hypothetical protein
VQQQLVPTSSEEKQLVLARTPRPMRRILLEPGNQADEDTGSQDSRPTGPGNQAAAQQDPTRRNRSENPYTAQALRWKREK